MNYSVSEENYLKAIFHMQQENGNVTTTALAEKLKSRPASITDMMKKLNAKNLLNYKPYYGFSLSSEGRKIAINIIRRHRLWEFFLAEKLGFNWTEVHSLAEELEHVSSKKLIDRLDEFLEFPSFDPHGDPIPDHKGKIKMVEKITILQLPLNKPATVIQVTNQTPQLLELLQHKQIAIGTRLEVKRVFDFDQSAEVKIKQQFHTLSQDLARNIFVSYDTASA